MAHGTWILFFSRCVCFSDLCILELCCASYTRKFLMLPCYKSTERDKAGLVYHLYILNCPVCRHVFILYISKYSFANVIMPKMPIFFKFHWPWRSFWSLSHLCISSSSTGNYRWRKKMEKSLSSRIRLKSKCTVTTASTWSQTTAERKKAQPPPPKVHSDYETKSQRNYYTGY